MQISNHLYLSDGEGTTIEKVVKYIDQHYNEPISLSLLSKHVGITPEHLSRLFKKKTGGNFGVYLMIYRLKQAEILMNTTNLKTYEIAEKVGYPNPSYFYRIYKQYKSVK